MTELIDGNSDEITLKYKNIKISLDIDNLNSVKEVKKIYKIVTQKNKTFYSNLRRKVLYFCKDFEFNLNFSKGYISFDGGKIYITIDEGESFFQYVIDLQTCQITKRNRDTLRKNYFDTY